MRALTKPTAAWDHPRMCGEHSILVRHANVSPGSSPHVRGARYCVRLFNRNSGIIPACAGSTLGLRSSVSSARDHPRMCGEHNPSIIASIAVTGIIPACAGSTCSVSTCDSRRWDHPRMCGEHPHLHEIVRVQWGSSPHVRGAPLHAMRLSHA